MTAFEQLKKELNSNSFQELFSNQNYIKEYLESRIERVYLEIEKEQIKTAYENGKKEGYDLAINERFV